MNTIFLIMVCRKLTLGKIVALQESSTGDGNCTVCEITVLALEVKIYILQFVPDVPPKPTKPHANMLQIQYGFKCNRDKVIESLLHQVVDSRHVNSPLIFLSKCLWAAFTEKNIKEMP